ncbi:FAD/NAD(P)-binding domain-containing protein [Rhizodiscina lignyota]|uniref:FAD/NAD(P)-binding domain-containing protein n=1 Tax=Rhizodiscina lignyota TaxID=1504668 RepID=A0A9P4IR97_9PEZI|nr:FAD/NAD(P)-binding domain-containing protein [Rhizodiscina lignyota]
MAIDTSKNETPVLIIGAGPVGLFLALRLSQSGVPVTVIEANSGLDDSTKALTHMPTIYPDFKRAGILDDVLNAAGELRSTSAYFRRTSDKSVITKLPIPPGKPGPCLLPQGHFCKILLKHSQRAGAQVLFGHRFESVRAQEGSRVHVDVSSDDGVKKTFDARFLVAADGGKSAVRKAAGIEFEGETLPAQLVATDLYYPFEKFGWSATDANFFADPQDYGLITPIDGKGLWRCSFGLQLNKDSGEGSRKEGLSMNEIESAVPRKFEKMLPSEPGKKPEGWKLVQIAPYKAQQLCAKTMRKRSVVLVGDAAHLTNPYAGMGLNTGIFDASSLADALVSIVQRDASDSLLDKWSDARRNMFLKVVDPMSRAAYWAFQDPDTDSLPDRHPMFKAMKAGPNAKPPELGTDVSKFVEFK